MSKRPPNPEAGFTLIEAIVIMVVLAIVSAMMLPYFGTSITQSSAPIASLKSEGTLNTVMAKITAQYRLYPHWQPSTLYANGTLVLPTAPNANGHLYTTIGGTSGTTEPGWQPTGIPVDGSVQWTQSPTPAPTLIGLQTAIGPAGTEPNNSFGNYSVVQNSFISFNASSQETSTNPGNRYLKVTIGLPASSGNGETLTTLFVAR
jgi:type II secretory pathway pseudopilin PulG